MSEPIKCLRCDGDGKVCDVTGIAFRHCSEAHATVTCPTCEGFNPATAGAS